MYYRLVLLFQLILASGGGRSFVEILPASRGTSEEAGVASSQMAKMGMGYQRHSLSKARPVRLEIIHGKLFWVCLIAQYR